MSFWVYVGRRLLFLIPMLLGITVMTFVISHAVPGDPVAATLGQRAVDDPTIVASFRRQWGLDRPLYEQYVIYVANLLQGDLGVSISTRRPVATDLAQYLPATFELSLAAIVLSVGLGIPLGMIAAVRRHTWIDHAARLVSLLGVAMPVFWLGLVALYLLYGRLGLFPGPGRLSSGVPAPPGLTGLYLVDSLLTGRLRTLLDASRHIALPALVLASNSMGIITRITRAAVLEVLQRDYVRTARAKGLAERVLLFRHVLRTALIPIVTVIGLAFGSLLSGAVMTETVFSWPGLGRYAFQSSALLDFPAIMGVTLSIALTYVFVNLLVDVLYAFINPEVRYE